MRGVPLTLNEPDGCSASIFAKTATSWPISADNFCDNLAPQRDSGVWTQRGEAGAAPAIFAADAQVATRNLCAERRHVRSKNDRLLSESVV
jgi:hypothetical protein